MTRPTEDEIEKAAEADCDKQAEELPYKSEFERAAYEVTFISGARWALEQSSKTCQLEWKRPEEELPEEDTSVLLCFDWQGERDVCVGTYTEGFWLHDAKWSEDVKVLAWCCISLPEWSEEK